MLECCHRLVYKQSPNSTHVCYLAQQLEHQPELRQELVPLHLADGDLLAAVVNVNGEASLAL